jgi:hypothetical protein
MTMSVIRLGRLCLRQRLHLLAVGAACFGIAAAPCWVSAVAESAGASAPLAYRLPQSVPAAWQDYGRLVQHRLQEWLSEAKIADALQGWLKNGAKDRDKDRDKDRNKAREAAPRFVARVWVSSKGAIDLIDFAGLDAATALKLRSLLVKKQIGKAPPPDMLQPLNLSLSLRAPK